MQTIMRYIAEELNYGEVKIDEYKLQLFPQTATWGIVLWEAEYDITPEPGQTLEQRRAKVLYEMNDRTPLTRNELTRKVERMTGAKVEILQHLMPYTLKIDATNPKQIPVSLIEDLREIIPAHLDFYVKGIHELHKKLYFAAAYRDHKRIIYKEYTPTSIKGMAGMLYAAKIKEVIIKKGATFENQIIADYKTSLNEDIRVEGAEEMRFVNYG